MSRDLHYLEIIVESIRAIFEYLDDKTEDDFYRDEILKHAVLMRLLIIGEYGGKVSKELQNRFLEVEWQQMKAARNFYVHAYDSVNWSYVWETVQTNLLPLKTKMQNIIAGLEKEM